MNKKYIFNFIAFQAAWFACVLSAAYGAPYAGFLLVVLIIIAHLWQARLPILELKLVLITALLGGLLDFILMRTGLIYYQATGWAEGSLFTPIWIIGLWLAFASTLNVSLRWLRGKPLASFLLGAVGGPMAYLGAQKLGAITLFTPQITLIILALSWGVITPLLVKIATHFDGYAHV